MNDATFPVGVEVDMVLFLTRADMEALKCDEATATHILRKAIREHGIDHIEEVRVAPGLAEHGLGGKKFQIRSAFRTVEDLDGDGIPDVVPILESQEDAVASRFGVGFRKMLNKFN